MSGQKTPENSQFARVALDGQRVDAAGIVVTQGVNSGIEPLADDQGRLLIVPVGGVTPFPGLGTRVQGRSYGVIQAPITGSPTGVQNIDGFNNSAGPLYVQLHDFLGVVPPANVPEVSVIVPAGSEFSIAAEYQFVAGLTVALSTTPGLFTAATADLYTSFIVWI